MSKEDRSNRAWKKLEKAGETECFWCSRTFVRPGLPPTIDHRVPKSLGGIIADGIIFACQTCNSARGNIPFEEYLIAVELERVMCVIERREYRRPKRRRIHGEWVVSTMTRRQIQLVEANHALSEIQWIEPHDLAADKRWEREAI